MAISFGGAVYAWNSAQIIALFVVGAVVWIAFATQQYLAFFTTTKDRMFPVHFLKSREAILLFLLMATGATAAFVPIYYIPIYFQFTRGDSALQAAVRLLPFIFVLSACILAQGAFMSRTGYYKPWYVCGTILGIIGGVLMCKSIPYHPPIRPAFPTSLKLLIAKPDYPLSPNHCRYLHRQNLRLHHPPRHR